ncbi:MAG TPA: HAMP domain-containing sensor histidine kinase [Gemmatimonadota bacterium]|nr:HAMP domain-containing sensor histidine kinase [Gemmatimonadota bacterium]
METVGRRLSEVSGLVAGRIAPERLGAASETSFDPESFIYLDTTLSAARERSGVANLTILDLSGHDWLSSDSSAVPGERTLAAAAGFAFDAACVGVAATSDLYRSREDYFLAACTPLKGTDSSVMAVLVAEAGNDYFGALEELSFGLILLDVFAGALLAVVGIVWAGVRRRLARAELAAVRSAQLAAMGQMVATVAHELKNPLGIIKNSAERIRKKYGHPDEPLFDFIPEEVDRLDALLRRYLQFARLEIGAIENVKLQRLITGIQENLPADMARGHSFEVRVPADLAVLADPAALRQVLLNLLLNAFAACAASPGAAVTLEAARSGREVEIRVKDTGVGMDGETLRRAAEPFFTTRADGSGLGIYLARTLTERMAGRMVIRSQAGAGTQVAVILPAAQAE